MKQLYAPNGELIAGTLETISGRANVSGWSEQGDPIYAGNTEVFWDDQQTVERDGQLVCLTESGDEFPFDQCTLRDEDNNGE